MRLTPPEDGDVRYARRHPDGPVVVYERAGRWTLAEGGRLIDVADDPGLPGLGTVLAAGAEIVRYHPHLRCTVRLGDRYGKVLSTTTPALLAAQAQAVGTPRPARLRGGRAALLRRSDPHAVAGRGAGEPGTADRGLAQRMGRRWRRWRDPATRRGAARPRRGARATWPRRCRRRSRTARRGRRTARADRRAPLRGARRCRCGRPTARRTRRRGCSTASGSGWSTSTGSRSAIPNATSPPSPRRPTSPTRSPAASARSTRPGSRPIASSAGSRRRCARPMT